MSFIASRRDLRLTIAAKAVSFFGDEVAAFALVLRLQAQGAGAISVAALLMSNLVPIVLLAGVAGRLVDRYDNRRLLVISGAGQALVCTGMLLSSSPAAVLTLVTVLGAGQAVNGAAWQAQLPVLVPPGRLPHAISRAQAAMTIAGLAGPALSGFLTGWLGVRAALLVDVMTFVVVTMAAVLLRQPRRTAPRGMARLEGGAAIVRRDRVMRTVLGLLALLILLAAAVNVVEVFLVRSTLGASAAWFGICSASYSLGVLAGAVLGGRINTPSRSALALVASAAELGAGLCAMGLAPNVLWLMAAGALTGMGNGVVNVTSGTLITAAAKPAERGRVAAVMNGATSGCLVAAYVVGGAVASVLSPREVFLAGGCLAMLAPVAIGRLVVRAATGSAQADFSRRSRLGGSRRTRVG